MNHVFYISTKMDELRNIDAKIFPALMVNYPRDSKYPYRGKVDLICIEDYGIKFYSNIPYFNEKEFNGWIFAEDLKNLPKENFLLKAIYDLLKKHGPILAWSELLIMNHLERLFYTHPGK